MSRSVPVAKAFIVGTPASRRREAFDYAVIVPTPFAMVGVRIESEVVIGVDYLSTQCAEIRPESPLAREAAAQIRAYVADARHAIELPFAALGTAYQHRVWRAIDEIPCGSTRAYGQLSVELRSSPRAVGAACGSNPIPLLVPCHRVVSTDGRLGGFMHSRDSFPLSIKRWLLEHEMR